MIYLYAISISRYIYIPHNIPIEKGVFAFEG